MSFDLTDRQIKLLEAVITEYLESSEPVGSQTIVERYKIPCSAATIRNEMADLMERGFLLMSHTSSGRKPTPLAYRFFIQELLSEEAIPVLQEVAIKQRMWPVRFETEKLLKQASLALSDTTHELAFATTNDGFSLYTGVANILDYAEFWDINIAKNALSILDRFEIMNDILTKASYGGKEVSILMGDEMEVEGLEESSFVFSKYDTRGKSGFIGILGPSRMKYNSVIPNVRYVKNLVEELTSGW
jgi:transcriptional regulator of heat shock response